MLKCKMLLNKIKLTLERGCGNLGLQHILWFHTRYMKKSCCSSNKTCNISLCVLHNLLPVHTLLSLQPPQRRTKKTLHTDSKNKDIDMKKLVKPAILH